MTYPTNQSFKNAQVSEAAEPRIELKAWLRNVAVDSEGSTASGPEFSDDFPAAGAIDGQRHHLNFGPAAGADDKIGKSGWKSDTSKQEFTKTTDDDWENDSGQAVQGSVQASNESSQITNTTGPEEDDFDTYTAATALAGQGPWVSVDGPEGANFMNVETVAAFGTSVNGVRIRNVVTGSTTVSNNIGSGGSFLYCSFRFKEIENVNASGILFGLSLLFPITGDGFSLGFFGGQEIYSRINVAAYQRVTSGKKFVQNQWHRVTVFWDRTTLASTIGKVFLDGEQIHEVVFDSTSWAGTVLLKGNTTAGNDTDFYFEDFRVGRSQYFDSGQNQNDIDWGATPIPSGRAKIVVTGETELVERIILGANYGFEFINGENSVRSATTQRELAMTFEADEKGYTSSVSLAVDRVGTPAPSNKDEIWVEIRSVDGANKPDTQIYATSTRVRANTISTTLTESIRFDFPIPIQLDPGVRYALVLLGDYDIDAANHVAWFSRSGPGTYANGEGFKFNQDTAVWDTTGHDHIFVFRSSLNEETQYDDTNEDDILGMRTLLSLTENYSMGFKLPHDVDVRGAKISVRRNGANGPPSGSTIRCEIYSDDGAGKPLASLVVGRKQETDEITWNTAREYVLHLNFPFELKEGVQYHLVIRGDWPPDGSNHLFLGSDTSTPSYAFGNMHSGADADPIVWSTLAGTHLIFAILGNHIPFLELEMNYSDNDIIYGVAQNKFGNPSRDGSWTFEFTAAELKRFWRIKIQHNRVTKQGSDRGQDQHWVPVLLSYTITQVFRNEKCLTVDFNALRSLSGIEIYGHPDEDGFCKIRIETSTGGPFTPITGYTELVGRRKGGNATTPTEDNGVVTSDCGYLRLIFPLTAFREMKICVLDNTDEFARILEVQAFRVEDWSDRVAENGYKESQSGDALRRRINGKEITVTLKNEDDELSPRVNTVFGDQLGNGVRLFPKVGFEGDATPVPQGTFYVENWPDPLQGPANIKVKARDGSKLMNTKVRARYTKLRRTFELMEYIGNLANIASVDQNLDPTSDSIDFYLPKEVNAYQECQLLAESVAFSQFFFDPDGYMRFRAIGNSSRDTNLENASGMTDPQRVGGPPQFIDDKMYVVISNTNGAPNEDLVIMEWDIKEATWTNRGVTSTSTKRHSGICQAFDGKLYIMDFDNVGAGAKLFEYDPSDLSITFIKDLLLFESAGFDAPGQNDGAGQDDGIVRLNVSELILGSRWIVSCESSRGKYHGKHYELDLATFEEKVDSTLYGATRQLQSVRTESKTGKIVALTRTAPGPPQTVKANEWDYFGNALTFKLDLFSNLNVVGHLVGMDGNGDGTLYWSFLNSTVTEDPPARLSRLDVNADTWVNTDLNTIADVARTGSAMEGDGIAIGDGFILAHWGQPSGADVQHRIMARDLKNANIITTDLGPLGSGASARIGQFRSHKTAEGFHYIYGFSGDFTVFEWRVRERTEKQEVAEFILFDGDGGTLRNIVTDLTDETGGKNAIINAAFVRSNPLKIDPVTEQIYEAPDLPWGVINGTLIEYDIEFKEDCDPSTVAIVSGNAIYGDSGAGTATLKNVEIRRATISIDITATGTITGLTLEGNPLRRQSTTIAVVLGSKQSKDRYGFKQFTLENKYIYNSLNLTGIGKSLIDRFETPKIRAKGVRLISRWDAEMFDRWTLRVPRKNIDVDVYIVGITRAYQSAEMSISIIEV